MAGRAALSAAPERASDLIVLDVMLPDLDGIEVTRRLRADGVRVPALFLTARDSLEDKLTGLTVGGDVYVTKPFSPAEIVARARAILRRTAGEADRDGRLEFSDLGHVRGDARGVACRGAAPVDGDGVQPAALLSPQSPPCPLQGADPRPRVALRLRRRRQRGRDLREPPAKELDACGPPLIHTIRLVGYTLREAGQECRFAAVSCWSSALSP